MIAVCLATTGLCHAQPVAIDTMPMPAAPRKQYYFYQGFTYGSQANFNPATVILNRGFEMMKIISNELYYDPFHYQYRFKNIYDNFAHPFHNVAVYGTGDFLREQVIPFGNPSRPYWYPNYTLHLIGGGITYTGLKEWFQLHGMAHPRLLSAATILTSAVINEAIEERERGTQFILNVDAIADFYIFDIGGMLLFQSERVNRFFSKTLNMRDWSRQPMLLLPGAYLGNCGQFISLKLKLPKTANLYFFSMMGLGGMAGLSYKFSNNNAFSMGFGQGPKRKNKELFGLPLDISLVPMVGFYFDRNNSLLASLELSNSANDRYHNYFAELNLYPGLIKIKNADPALWMALSRNGSIMLGISTRYTMGVGLGLK